MWKNIRHFPFIISCSSSPAFFSFECEVDLSNLLLLDTLPSYLFPSLLFLSANTLSQIPTIFFYKKNTGKR